jgi:Spy/CpxP family protein refolding chaperone
MKMQSILTAAFALAAATGCAQSQSQDPPTTASAADEATHGPPGPEMVVGVALHELELTPDQRATLKDALHAGAPAMAAHATIKADVAAGVRAGQLDEAKIRAELDANVPEAALPQMFATLHDTLTPDQRRAFVDILDKKIDAHEATPAHADHLLGHLLGGLDLTKDQHARIDPILAAQQASAPDMQAFHTALRAKLQTFAADRFDAAAFAKDLPPVGMRAHVESTIHTLAAILPLLEPAQRDKLATMIELMPMGH